MFSKCFRGECMWQLWKNLKGWWCGTLTSTILITFQFHVTRWGPWVCISSITIICSMTYSKYLCRSLRCHLRFLARLSTLRSPSPEKKNVIFLYCSKMEADLKKQYLVYGIFFWPETWRGSLFILLPPLICQIPDFNCIERFWFLFWSILNGVTLKTSNCIVIGCFSLLPG